MKLQWNTSWRMTLCAVAVMGASFAHAQSQPAPAPETPHVAPAHTDAHKHPAKKHPKPHAQHSAKHGKYANPAQHEAAAVAGEQKRGAGSNAQGLDYERNALNRCEIFKTADDRNACVERVRQPQISGSVEGGGLIREYTQTVQVPAAPAVQHNGASPAVHPHMVHPAVEPIRK